MKHRTLDTLNRDDTYREPEDLRPELYRLILGESPPAVLASERASELFRLLVAGPDDDVRGISLGRFTVERWAGAGGFGVVFLAHDNVLQRKVAIKLPHAQSLARLDVRKRFLREARVAVQLRHPNIVPVVAAGEEQGICYIASEYCPGPTLHDWLSKQSQPVAIKTAVAFVTQLADAVQHAHDHRVLHRDIKPSNILLHPDAGAPAEFMAKITDFGLAKLLDGDASMTENQGMLGTPRYMSPEQAAGDRTELGPGTDVFGLGAVLYELLTDVAPFAGQDQAQTLHRLLNDDVTPPRRLRADVPRDLEAICLRCLEKATEDRYGSAQALADDLRRFDAGEVTRGCRRRQWKSSRRRPWRRPHLKTVLPVATIALVGLHVLTSGFRRPVGSTHAQTVATVSEHQPRLPATHRDRGRLRTVLLSSRVQRAHQAIEEDDLRQAFSLLRQSAEESPEFARSFVWRYLWSQATARGEVVETAKSAIYDLRFSHDGSWMAACGADDVLRLYDGKTFALQRSIATQQTEVNAVAFSPDGRSIATTGDDGTVRLWEADSGRQQRVIRAHDDLAYDIEFTPDGATLITCGNEPCIRFWSVRTGKATGVLEGHEGAVEAITLSPDGAELASAARDATARLWDLRSGETRQVLAGHRGAVIDIAYSASGDYLLTGSNDQTIKLWRAADARCVQTESHVDPIASVAFLGEDQVLVAADRGGSVHAWKQKTPGSADESESKPLHRWSAHGGRVWNVTATPDGTGVLTAGADGKVIHWKRPPRVHATLEASDDQAIQDIAFGASSTRLHFIESGTGVQTWDLATGGCATLAHGREGEEARPLALCMLPGRRLVAAFSDDVLEAVDLSSAMQPLTVLRACFRSAVRGIDELAASSDGTRLAIFSYASDATEVYDLAEQRLQGTFEAYAQSMAIDADGTRLAVSDGDDVVVWNIDRHERVARLRGHSSSIRDLEFSPDGRWLCSGSNDRDVRLWDLEGASGCSTMEGHRANVQTVAFSPDGRLLASGDARGKLTFWFLPEATELISVNLGAPIEKVVFSPDGNRVAVQMLQEILVLQANPAGLAIP